MSPPKPERFHWRRAFVTGASSGIGAAFARQLADAGVDLILVGESHAALERVKYEALLRGVDVQTVCSDLSTDVGVDRAVESLRNASPAVDLLINNAGTGPAGFFAELASDDVRRTMRVNNDALVRLTHTAIPRMLAEGSGTIVLVSSAASRGPLAQHALYAATKAFVTNFGQSLSQELSTTSVTCTTLLVGYTRTPYFERNGLKPDVPADKWATAEQVASQGLDAAHERRQLVTTGPSHRWLRQLATRYPSAADSIAGRSIRQLRRWIVSKRTRPTD